MIRNAEDRDINAVLEIETANFYRPWTRRSFETEIFKARNHFLVYEADDEVAGYIVFWYILDEAEIADIAVSDKFKRRKIAETLIRHCLNLHNEVRIVYLEVAKDNLPAVSLYRKLGFTENGEIRDYYGAGKNALRMSMLSANYRGD